MKIPSMNLTSLEMALSEISECFDSLHEDEEEFKDILVDFDSDDEDDNFPGQVKKQEQKRKRNSDDRLHRELKSALKKVLEEVRDTDDQKVVQELLGSSDVIFSTLSTTGSMPMRRMGQVCALIVDEASACTEPEILVALNSEPKKLLLVGDPKQLPATVKSPDAVKYGLTQSLQERLMFKNKCEYTMLDTQYRMHPEISKWPLAKFYDDKVKDGPNVTDEAYTSNVALLTGEPYIWVQVSGKEQKDEHMSTMNEAEGMAIIGLLLKLVEDHNLPIDWFTPDRIRIITFYKAQEDYLRFKLKQYNLNVTVSTVDASQGCEADMVIVSFVRGTSGQMGFIKDKQRLNVAVTRAKYQLVCVGNHDAIAGLAQRGGNFVLRDMAQDALARCQIVAAPGPLPPPPLRVRKPSPTSKGGKRKKRTKGKQKR